MANTKLPARLLDDSVIPAAYISGTLAVDTNTLRVDSTNNRVGIGITSPSVKLHVRGSAVSGATFNADDGLTIEQAGGGGSNINLISSTNTGVLFSDAAARAVGLLNYSHSDNSMRFNTNGSEAMRIDSSGNVGIGVTPYTIYSGWTGLDIGSGGITSITSGNENITLSSNAYLNSSGAWAYKTTNEASSYLQSAGTHYWRTAASGSANAAITWNNAMFMNASGNIGIGTTNPLAALSVGSGSLTDGALPIQISTGADGTQSYFAVNRNGGYGALFGYSASSTYKGLIIRNVVSSGTANADGISLMTNNTHIRMHITGAGNVGIGNTNPGYPLDVTSNSSALGIRIRGRSDHIGELNFASNDGSTIYSQIQSLAGELRIKAISNIPMTLFTNNTEKVRIDWNGNVGIGTDDPKRLLQVGDNTQAIAALSLQATSSGKSRIYMGNNDANANEYAGLISYDHNAGNLEVWSGGGNKMTLLGTSQSNCHVDIHSAVSVGFGNTGSAGDTGINVKGWYNATAHSYTAGYMHIKTSLWGGGSPHGNSMYIMGGWKVMALRYSGANSYGQCTVFFHNWNGSVAPGFTQTYGPGPWTGWLYVYVNSSGYVTLRVDGGSYKAYWFDLYQAPHYGVRNIYVTDTVNSGNATL